MFPILKLDKYMGICTDIKQIVQAVNYLNRIQSLKYLLVNFFIKTNSVVKGIYSPCQNIDL
jgi:hypothetical protein